MRLAGWGRYPVIDCRTASCRDAADLTSWLAAAPSAIARGNGRAYGDAALNPDLTLMMRGMDRFRAFDTATGRLECEAGVLLADILERFVPRGWFPAVMPGTKFVTVGGMIAADVHGKNHHRAGTFGRHVDSVTLLGADGIARICSRTASPELFRATQGGMGLTGVILSAAFRLIPVETAYLREETLVARDLDHAMALFEESADWPYSVAWIDCLARGRRRGRALVSRGAHLARADLTARLSGRPLVPHRKGGRRIPCDAPAALLNGATVRAFNAAYYAAGSMGARTRVVHYDRFFFPLDRLREWNRLYGRRGFVQYQCVLPKAESARGLAALLDRIAGSGAGSFLAVLKLLGGEGEGPLSFPMEGYTLALDFPMRSGTLALLAELDRLTAAHGGRVYLAKDARLAPDALRARLRPDRRVRGAARRNGRAGEVRVVPVAEARAVSGAGQTALILGATSDIGRAVAIRFADEGYTLQLAARDAERLERDARDIEVRCNAMVSRHVFDVLDDASGAAMLDALPSLPDVVVCVVGLLGDQAESERDLDAAARVYAANFTGPARLLAGLANRMEARGSGTIVGVGSVAGDRGRASNYVYGAAKAGFAAFLSGLRARLARKGVHVATVKPGFVRTRMTEGMNLPAP